MRCAEIEDWTKPKSKQPPPVLQVRGTEDPLHEGLADGPASHLIRSFFAHMGFDENRLFGWRLHHKLVQALVISAFAPQSFPPTRGLVSVMSQEGGGTLRDRVRAWKERGYLFKRTLVTGSGEHGRVDCTRQSIVELEANTELKPVVEHEQFMLQKQVDFTDELRVHSVEDEVVENLTVGRYRGDYTHTAQRLEVNEFVDSLLKRLPAGLTSGTVLSWDVARASDGRLLVIEVNITGFNPDFRPGFQCSGFFAEYMVR